MSKFSELRQSEECSGDLEKRNMRHIAKISMYRLQCVPPVRKSSELPAPTSEQELRELEMLRPRAEQIADHECEHSLSGSMLDKHRQRLRDMEETAKSRWCPNGDDPELDGAFGNASSAAEKALTDESF